MNLTELANKFGSDKGTKVGNPPHRYTFLYDLMFYELRDRPLNFLELGLAVGGPELGGPVDRTTAAPSVMMWLEYFPNAHVYGFDISDFSHVRDPRFTFVRGDGGSAGDLERLAQAAPQYDVIIDDASHASYHQQLAFKILFSRLAKNGLYIIEDLHWQSPFYESKLPRVPKTAEFIGNFFMNGIFVENDLLSRDFMISVKERVHTFSAFPDFTRGGATKMIVLRAN